ncbi:hypothetical protein ILYODFUR_027697 [Ilyodon furcidens]|uniref:Uncharacterized protein n=1 Tax=Ilyodon furcidens TaxID=33524 RepID=A0ABV0VHQ9_9TELE
MRAVARRFAVSVSVVSRAWRRYQETGQYTCFKDITLNSYQVEHPADSQPSAAGAACGADLPAALLQTQPHNESANVITAGLIAAPLHVSAITTSVQAGLEWDGRQGNQLIPSEMKHKGLKIEKKRKYLGARFFSLSSLSVYVQREERQTDRSAHSEPKPLENNVLSADMAYPTKQCQLT